MTHRASSRGGSAWRPKESPCVRDRLNFFGVADLRSSSREELVNTLRDVKFDMLTISWAVGFGDILFGALLASRGCS